MIYLYGKIHGGEKHLNDKFALPKFQAKKQEQMGFVCFENFSIYKPLKFIR